MRVVSRLDTSRALTLWIDYTRVMADRRSSERTRLPALAECATCHAPAVENGRCTMARCETHDARPPVGAES